MTMPPILELAGVSRRYGSVLALDHVDLRVEVHESVALVGRSGSGKTTISRLIVGLEPPDTGVVRLLGEDVTALRGERRRAVLGRVGLIGQDPYAALSPSARVLDIVSEPLRIGRTQGGEARRRAAAALAEVGLEGAVFHARTADELSGGERQRVALARAIVTDPWLLIADEATSMLDAPRQQVLLGLLTEVRSTRPTALLFITHDLALAAAACRRVVVLDAGRVAEDGPTPEVLTSARSEAARALVDAAHVRAAMMAAVVAPA
jgi:ABC-type glutathione transport system ATPase component